MTIVACADRITTDADCFGHVGMIARAGRPIPYAAIIPRWARWPRQQAYGKTRGCWRQWRQASAKAKPSSRTASRKTVAWRRADWVLRPGQNRHKP